MCVCVCAGKESDGVLGELHGKVVTLKHTTTESSVIATRSVGVATGGRCGHVSSAVGCVRRGIVEMCMRCQLTWILRWRPLLWMSTSKRL